MSKLSRKTAQAKIWVYKNFFALKSFSSLDDKLCESIINYPMCCSSVPERKIWDGNLHAGSLSGSVLGIGTYGRLKEEGLGKSWTVMLPPKPQLIPTGSSRAQMTLLSLSALGGVRWALVNPVNQLLCVGCSWWGGLPLDRWLSLAKGKFQRGALAESCQLSTVPEAECFRPMGADLGLTDQHPLQYKMGHGKKCNNGERLGGSVV